MTITGPRQPDKIFERSLIILAMKGGIPDSLISDITPPMKFQFVGRGISVGDRCRWTGSNTIQCHGFGEMNWSIHPDMAEATEYTRLQEARNRRLRQTTIEQEAEVPILFEGTPVTSKKIQYRLNGLSGLLAKQEGSRTLMVYYVTAPVRGYYVSCVLSYWTSDYIEGNGLPPLLGTVTQLQ